MTALGLLRENQSSSEDRRDPVLYTPFNRSAQPGKVPIQVDPAVIDFDL